MGKIKGEIKMGGMSRDRRTARRRMRIALFIVGGLLIWATYIGLRQEEILKAQRKAKAELTQTLEQERATQKDLKYQAERLQDPEYIANLARSKYYLSKKGEVIFEIIRDPSRK